MNKINFTLLMLILFVSIHVDALEISGKIIKVGRLKSRAIIESSEAHLLKVGKVYVFDKNCEVGLMKQDHNRALFMTSKCKNKEVIEKGNRVFITQVPNDLDFELDGLDTPGENENVVASGIRIGAFKGFYSGDSDVTISTSSGSATGDITHLFSAYVGFAYIPIESIGGIIKAIYMSYDDEVMGARGDINITYGVNDRLYLFGGANVHKYTSEVMDEFDLGFGGQCGGGFQINKNLGIEFGYSVIQNSIETTNADISLRIKGIELGVNATF